MKTEAAVRQVRPLPHFLSSLDFGNLPPRSTEIGSEFKTEYFNFPLHVQKIYSIILKMEGINNYYFKKGTQGTVETISCVESETLHKVHSFEPARPMVLISDIGDGVGPGLFPAT